MSFSLKKTVAPLVLAFAAMAGLTGCENANDIAAKPATIATLVENSASICQPAMVGNTAAYTARLNAALDKVAPSDLATLKASHITVCLDQRLNNQKTGWFDTEAQGVLTENPDGKGGAVTVWDNGTQPEDAGFFHSAASDHSQYILHAFASHLRDGDVKPGERWIAYDTTTSDGDGNTYPGSSAKPEAKFDKDTRAQNPFLQQSPVKAPAAPTAPGW